MSDEKVRTLTRDWRAAKHDVVKADELDRALARLDRVSEPRRTIVDELARTLFSLRLRLLARGAWASCCEREPWGRACMTVLQCDPSVSQLFGTEGDHTSLLFEYQGSEPRSELETKLCEAHFQELTELCGLHVVVPGNGSIFTPFQLGGMGWVTNVMFEMGRTT